MKKAVVLFGHGTVESLDDLTAFVTIIRRGHAPPPELIEDLLGRYRAIGGHSPFNDIARELAKLVESELGVPTRIAMRLWKPTAKEVLAELGASGVQHVAFVPLAQHSGPVYAEAARKAAAELASEGVAVTVAPADNWGQVPQLLDAYAARVRDALAALSPDVRAKTTTVFSAHSLPKAIIDAGDAYEKEFRASVASVVERLGGDGVRPMVAFQSQGAQTPGARPVVWLGPDLAQTLDAVAARGDQHVIFAPIGFLADHVEVLYDLDIEAKAMAQERGLSSSRIVSLNTAPELVNVIADLARPLLAGSAA